ncbi:MAG: hypothetical protein LBS24_07310 [Clostridiales Family XIII bacterium]|jgi:hypothetical protein|nr:hypothetical protein [Clostridiales Family XIII bacterium]
MEIAIAAVLSMAAGSLITGSLVLIAGSRPRLRARAEGGAREETRGGAKAPSAEAESGKPTLEEQLAAIVGYERRGGLKVE